MYCTCVCVRMCVWDPLSVALLQFLSVRYAVFTEISGFYSEFVSEVPVFP
uniref:Uncharacterized protein n=1 Tax=Anguilla anguilla TaxID=7936 RepID=A0A0E9V5R6_ANGAN